MTEVMEWADSVYSNKSQRKIDFNSVNDSILRDYLNTDMSLPCETCPVAMACEINGNECSAFRNWASNGNYELEQIQKHLRLPRS